MMSSEENPSFAVGTLCFALSMTINTAAFWSLDRGVLLDREGLVARNRQISENKGRDMQFEFVETPIQKTDLVPEKARKISNRNAVSADPYPRKKNAGDRPRIRRTGRADQLAQKKDSPMRVPGASPRPAVVPSAPSAAAAPQAASPQTQPSSATAAQKPLPQPPVHDAEAAQAQQSTGSSVKSPEMPMSRPAAVPLPSEEKSSPVLPAEVPKGGIERTMEALPDKAVLMDKGQIMPERPPSAQPAPPAPSSAGLPPSAKGGQGLTGQDRINTQEMIRTRSFGARLIGMTSFEATGSGMGEYMKNLKDRVWLSWFPYIAFKYPQDFKTADAVISITISAKGDVKMLQVVESEGSPTFASFCMEAIQRASNFGPLPQEILALIGKDELEIKFGFHYR